MLSKKRRHRHKQSLSFWFASALCTLEPSVMGEPDEGFRVSPGAPLTADTGLESSKPVERSGCKYTSVRVNQKLPTGKLKVTEPASTRDEAAKGVAFLGLLSAEFYSRIYLAP